MISKTMMAFAAIAALTGIMTMSMNAGPAFAASAEKVPLVQQYEQFAGQEVSGWCKVKFDGEGNLHWHIKVKGLVPGTAGHFDLNHSAGDVDVPFVADDDGNANSEEQIILAADIPDNTSLAACHVHATGASHADSPGIAVAQVETI